MAQGFAEWVEDESMEEDEEEEEVVDANPQTAVLVQ